jgi:flavin-dependent dehydrogenase
MAPYEVGQRMTGRTYDVVVVGARCAGAPTAMLLARVGYRVLLLDRARFPRDTVSTHFIWPGGVDHLNDWGLLDAVRGTGCPPIRSMHYEMEDVRLAGEFPLTDAAPAAYAPRRHVLDGLLADAASEAGAEFRDGCRVTGLSWDDGRVTGVRYRSPGGRIETAHTRLVVGADGRRSSIADLVGAPAYATHPTMTVCYYSYWSGVDLSACEIYTRLRRQVAALPTNDGLTLVSVYFPYDEFARIRSDSHRYFDEAVRLVAPHLHERLRCATRVERLRGVGDQPNFLRRPWGPGWVLIGDAGYTRDSLTARGMTDAFEHAALLAGDLRGDTVIDHAARRFGRLRDRLVFASYYGTLRAAGLRPQPDVMRRMRAAAGDPAQTQRYLGALGGITPPDEVVPHAISLSL